MQPFMQENFLLNNEVAVLLYHKYAKLLPIIDYHCHINQHEIVINKQFKNLTELWLSADHYKWRAMRGCGIAEEYITGNATDYDKFMAWTKALNQLIGNPLYHWTHLELQRYFNINQPLTEINAAAIWQQTTEILTSGKLNVCDILQQSKVEIICTTDDPLDDLLQHQQLQQDSLTKVLPTFRPDNALAINKPSFTPWIQKLSAITHMPINNYTDYLHALSMRIQYFHSVGCRISDHALDYVPYATTNALEINQIFTQVMLDSTYKISLQDENKFRSYTLIQLAVLYNKSNWSMQLHINARRNNNSVMLNTIGADTGFDAINDSLIANNLAQLLDQMNSNQLPRTILYSNNPTDYYVLGSIMGSFQDSTARGKLQFGSAWWFNDHLDGMELQLKTLANLGVLATFVGMLTDSRSFVSYVRHEYFRRILCNLIGTWVVKGEYPNDEKQLSILIENICYYNAKNYFKF